MTDQSEKPYLKKDGTPRKKSRDGGRPFVKVDEILLEKLTKLHLSDQVLADILGIGINTLHRRFHDRMEKWKSESKSKMANVLFDEALNKREPWALKALAQRHLGYADKIESKSEVVSTGFSVEFVQSNTSTKEIDDKKTD